MQRQLNPNDILAMNFLIACAPFLLATIFITGLLALSSEFIETREEYTEVQDTALEHISEGWCRTQDGLNKLRDLDYPKEAYKDPTRLREIIENEPDIQKAIKDIKDMNTEIIKDVERLDYLRDELNGIKQQIPEELGLNKDILFHVEPLHLPPRLNNYINMVNTGLEDFNKYYLLFIEEKNMSFFSQTPEILDTWDLYSPNVIEENLNFLHEIWEAVSVVIF